MTHRLLPCALLLLAGCVNLQPVPDNSRYHILDHAPTPQDEPIVLETDTPHLHIAQIDLPSYHDSKKLAIRKTSTEIEFSETHRWVEPLEDSISRALTSHLRSRLNPRWTFSSYPGRRSSALGYEVQLRFTRLEGDRIGQAVIEGQLQVFESTPGLRLRTHATFKMRRLWLEKDPAELPTLLSEMVQELGDEILKALQEAL